MIGRVFRIENHMANFRRPGTWWRSFKDISGGVHYDWGAHNVDWILGLMGGDAVIGVAGYAQKRMWEHVTNQDEMKWTLRFASGAVADLVQSSIAASSGPRWRVVGTGGSAVSHWGPNPEDRYFEVTQPQGEFQFPVVTKLPFKADACDSFYLNLADHLHRGDPPLAPMEEARRVIAVLDAAEKSAEAKREQPVEFEQE
jgi:predicted dehydrogenase